MRIVSAGTGNAQLPAQIGDGDLARGGTKKLTIHDAIDWLNKNPSVRDDIVNYDLRRFNLRGTETGVLLQKLAYLGNAKVFSPDTNQAARGLYKEYLRARSDYGPDALLGKDLDKFNRLLQRMASFTKQRIQ